MASLDTIHEMLGSGKWTMDFDESGAMTRVNWSDEFRRMLGYRDANDFPDVLESWSDLLHPKDKERILKEFNETIADYTGKKTYDVEYRLLTKNAGYRWYRAVGKPTRRADGSPITYVGVFLDITERKDMLAKLAHQQESLNVALEEANQANKAKTAFLSNMSHEIRTPMNAIIGLNNIALNDPTISEQTREYLERIGVSAHHLLGIINDILDMSRIESGRMTIKSEEFSFAKMLEQINTIVSGQCNDKGLKYDCRTIGTIEDYYIGDAMKLRQVLINILGNAVKFTPEGGAVSFTIEDVKRLNRQATLRFTIDDDRIACNHAQLVLSHLGITCETVLSGEEAVELVRIRHTRREDFNLILVDWKMPEMDGLETTRIIRATDQADAKTIPIIALTANAFDEDVQRSMQAGLNAHLSKPVEPDLLFETLEELLAE